MHCRASAQPLRHPKELSTEEGFALLADAVRMGTPVFILSGGDPAKRPDLLDLVREIRERGVPLIITDQHRADHRACDGNRIVRTPNIDKLAARGWASDAFYVCSPICMPNRASLMTGRMPMVHGVRHNGIPLALNSVCFTDLMHAAGWRTVMVGKSHLQTMTGQPPAAKRPTWDGLEPPPAALAEALRDRVAGDLYDQESQIRWRNDPKHDVVLPYYGFDEVALANEHGDLVEGHYTRWLRARRADGDSLRGQKNATPDPKVVTPQAWRTRLPEELYPTTYVAEITKDYLEKFAADRSRPFFLKCSFPDPHHPFTPPGKWFDMYDQADVALPGAFHHPKSSLPPHLAAMHAERDAGKAVKGGMTAFACTEKEARGAIALNYGSISMIDGNITDGYPIINYEYAIVNSKQSSSSVATAVRSILEWAINPADGNSPDFLNPVDFQALPSKVEAQSVVQIKKIQ